MKSYEDCQGKAKRLLNSAGQMKIKASHLKENIRDC